MLSILPGMGPPVTRGIRLRKDIQKYWNRLSSKLIESFWLLVVFQLDDSEELF